MAPSAVNDGVRGAGGTAFEPVASAAGAESAAGARQTGQGNLAP
jgi:hypothetical protein